MIRILKRLAILAALWIGVSTAGGIYLNTRTLKEVEADLHAVLAPALGTFDATLQGLASYEIEPLPADDVMRAQTATALADVRRSTTT